MIQELSHFIISNSFLLICLAGEYRKQNKFQNLLVSTKNIIDILYSRENCLKYANVNASYIDQTRQKFSIRIKVVRNNRNIKKLRCVSKLTVFVVKLIHFKDGCRIL